MPDTTHKRYRMPRKTRAVNIINISGVTISKPTYRARLLAQGLHGKSLTNAILNGLTISLLEAPWWIAMLALVFSGPLAAYLGQAALYMMVGAVISMTAVSFFSSWRGAIWLPQDVPATMLVIIGAEIICSTATAPGINNDALFATMIVAIAMASILTGALMYALGTLRMGKLVRRIPLPVMAGFLSGTGCLMVLGGISNSLGDTSDSLLTAASIMHWLPCVALALLIHWLSLRIKSAALIPLMLLGAGITFFVIAHLAGESTVSLQKTGWLFSEVPTVTRANALLTTEQISNIQWQALLAQAPNFIALALASALAMLLNNGGFALTVQKPFNQDNDLRATGLANLCSGLMGGWCGYMSPACSAVNAKQGQQLPLTGLLVALITGTLLWHATQLFSYIPRFIVGSVIAYIGLCFLYEWVFLTAKRLSRVEYGTLLTVTAAAVAFGLMEAVALGFGISGLLATARWLKRKLSAKITRTLATNH